jgi:predicted AAA+ superfamily ATPase
MDALLGYYYKLLRETSIDFQRYIYSQINWNSRFIGLTGPRGAGKTTLILQHIKKCLNPEEALYVTTEVFYFSDHNLLDLADSFIKRGGKYLFVDEIHKYKEWSRELKLIYDYHPRLNVVFTGSSVLDINKGAADLSRRAIMYRMQGLSFREYLRLFHGIPAESFSLHDVLTHKVTIPEVEHPLPLFDDYLRRGYYPFMMDEEYDLRLQQIVNQTLESDIPQYANMNVTTGRKLKLLMAIIAKSAPFKPNFSNIAASIGASRNNIADYCLFIEEAGLIAQLRDSSEGVRSLGKVDKIYLDNTNLIYLLAKENANIGNIRETFFFNQLRLKHNILSSPISDFEIEGITFEVGGKNKGQKQLQGASKAYVVKDNIESGYTNIVPLWQFGMLY